MIVGIKLNDMGKTYYFKANSLNLNVGDFVIVDTEKGLQYGEVVLSSVDVSKNDKMEYKNVIRIANKSDYKKNA